MISEMAEDGSVKQTHEVPHAFTMLLPAFRWVETVYGIEGQTNPRVFILADKTQRNPDFPEVFSAGVWVAIAPVGKKPVPSGFPRPVS
ncbi:MAG: hypothetical protein GY789_21595 [Hyphomicrobiales bacterium]|nr:hypothetical protein [Hyphomicrobiales bacterium]